MDLFKRIVTPTKKAVKQVDQLTRFDKIWISIKASLSSNEDTTIIPLSSDELVKRLQSLADILVFEFNRSGEGTTGPCLEYLLKNDILGELVRLVTSNRPPRLKAKGDAIRLFANLVILLDERFIVHNAVHKPLVRLLKSCIDLSSTAYDHADATRESSQDSVGILAEDEEDLIDLVCHLCSRIKTFPELLVLFFFERNASQRPHSPSPPPNKKSLQPLSLGQTLNQSTDRPMSPTLSESSTIASSSSRFHNADYEFLLFNHLLKYIHREGHVGDFSRAGLLFLIDVAMSSGEEYVPKLARNRIPSSSPLQATPPSNGINEVTLALAEYLLDSDFADVLGAGLGALYGLLPSKLIIGTTFDGDNEDGVTFNGGGMVLGGMGLDTDSTSKKESEDETIMRMKSLGLGLSSSTEFKTSLALFLKLIEFTQDVLRRSPSSIGVSTPSPVPSMTPATALVASAVASSILSSIRTIFLEAVLYPSILECSEIDGSAVAVLTYLDAMLHTTETDSKLSDTILRFLMADDIDDHSSLAPRSPPQLKSPLLSPHAALTKNKDHTRRRKSQALVLIESASNKPLHDTYFTSIGRFSLKDFLSQNLNSRHQPTALASLKLFNTLLTKHDRFTISLMGAIPDNTATCFPPTDGEQNDAASTTSSEHFQYPDALQSTEPSKHLSTIAALDASIEELHSLLALASLIDNTSAPTTLTSSSYIRYLEDAQQLIAQDPSFLRYLKMESSVGSRPLEYNLIPRHRLDLTSPILPMLTFSLAEFFHHSPVHNLALTAVLASLAACAYRSLESWLLPGLLLKQAAPEQHLVQSISPVLDSSEGVVIALVRGLVEEVAHYRRSIDGFDRYLAERRQGLMFVDNLADALDHDDFGIQASSDEQSPTTSLREGFLRPSATAAGDLISPFALHYRQTGAITVLPASVDVPSRYRHGSYNFSGSEDEVIRPSPAMSRSNTPLSISLSTLLDNVVVLEEAIKELVAIVHCRRSLGIDSIV